MDRPTVKRWMWLGVCVLLGIVVACIAGFLIELMTFDQRAGDRSQSHQPMNGIAAPATDGDRTSGSEGSKPLFEEVSPDTTNLRFAHRYVSDHPQAYLYDSGYACGGVCLGDVNGDGLCDIFLVSGPDANALFLNKGGFAFEKSLPASEAISGRGTWGVGACMADVDGDGNLDIYVCNYEAPNRLWLNRGPDASGRMRLTECGTKAGLSFAGPSQFPYFADFDGDGDLDLFLLTNRVYSPFGRPRGVASELGPDMRPRVKEQYARYFRVVRPSLEVPGKNKAPPPFLLEYGHSDRLFRNDGLGEDGVPRFEDVTRVSGIDGVPGHGLSALVWDINRDGRQDIYVANDFTSPDRLWLNLGSGTDGAFQFRDAAKEFVPYTTWSSMGSDVGDLDGDGRIDFMVADMAGSTHYKAMSTMAEINSWRRWVLENGWPRQSMRNMLFIGSAAGRFREAAFLAGIARSDWTWAVKFGDFDLDGRNDLFLTTGAARVFTDSDIFVRPDSLVGRTEWDIFRDKPEMRETNIAFRNAGRLKFTDVSRLWNLDKESMSYSAASGDLDADGDLDLVVCNFNASVSLHRNHASERGAHWLRVRLEGAGANRFGFGSVATAALQDGTRLVRLMSPQTGYLSANEPVLHFGLGVAEQVQSLEVRWPTGRVQRLGPQRADQLVVVREADDNGDQDAHDSEDAPRFVEVATEIGLRYSHRDRPFDDYQREFLLPGKLSQFGPGVAVADVDGNGLDDVFVGGAAGQSGALFLHRADHTFARLEKTPWAAHARSEDMGALFFDADRDGDLDLYVARGSNEWNAGVQLYADGLYLNQSTPDGPTVFAEAKPGSLPDLRNSGSCVVGADFDRDGDVDLFVGSRSVPGQYPLTPESALLRNDGVRPREVKLSDVTETVAPALRRAGLVTGGLWSDADGDGWPDLLVTCEWGPVRLFLNREGRLVEATNAAGLGGRLGWWNAVAGADFDGDGDIDYAALNVGLNTKYDRPTPENPAVLYRGDMDDDGVVDLVEARSSSEGELPVRGRAITCKAMPLLREQFPTYKSFAAASLVDIYGDAKLNSAYRVLATEFESGLWINESVAGKPRFSWRTLPVETQMSPCFGAVAADFFGDGNPSLVVVQNLFTREPQTGLWRGGLGCVLRPSNKNAVFTAVGSDRSGFAVAGDGKGLAIIDLDANGQPDLVATQNNDKLLAFRQATSADGERPTIAVRLAGPPGNPLGFGARVSLIGGGETLAITEIQGGSGYLSQSTAVASFVLPEEAKSLEINVLWPTGEETRVPIEPGQLSVSVPLR